MKQKVYLLRFYSTGFTGRLADRHLLNRTAAGESFEVCIEGDDGTTQWYPEDFLDILDVVN